MIRGRLGLRTREHAAYGVCRVGRSNEGVGVMTVMEWMLWSFLATAAHVPPTPA